MTSYNIIASEFAAYTGEAKDESKSKKSKKAQSQSENDDDDSEDSDDIRKFLQKNKKPAVKRAAKKKDALFRLKYWRIVLGECPKLGIARNVE